MSAPTERPKVPVESVVYGEVVYWITILAAILCTIGPLVAVAYPENNLLDPHKVFAAIFAQEEPGGVWALSANEEPVLNVGIANGSAPDTGEVGPMGVREAVKVLEEFQPPAADTPAPEMVIGGELRLVRMAAGAEEGEAFTLHRIREGHEDEGKLVSAHKARVELLDVYKNEVVTDGHYWMADPTSGDSLTQFGLALGCSVALWGLLLTAGIFFRKGVLLYALLAIWVATLVFVSAAGFVNLH